MFKDVNLIVFDEFVLENNGYLKNEITKFESVLRSICRGKGKQVRDVPVYMLANYVVLLNPYYIFLVCTSDCVIIQGFYAVMVG